MNVKRYVSCQWSISDDLYIWNNIENSSVEALAETLRCRPSCVQTRLNLLAFRDITGKKRLTIQEAIERYKASATDLEKRLLHRGHFLIKMFKKITVPLEKLSPGNRYAYELVMQCLSTDD